MRFDDLVRSPQGNKLHFRVSLDYPDRDIHDAARGTGNFDLALQMLAKLSQSGFGVSVARQKSKDEKIGEVDAAFNENGRMRVYACTLVDDDEDYDLGSTLSESMKIRIMLKHHRCYSCFGQGASCSEL